MRINYSEAAPQSFQAMLDLEHKVMTCGLERNLIELVKTRVSQINKCAYCIDMHTKDARHLGETEQRLYGLSAWRETNYYTPRERAALDWAEALTLISDHGVSDQLYSNTKSQFSDKEMVELTLAIIAINGWNRLSISFGTEAGTYQPKKEITNK